MSIWEELTGYLSFSFVQYALIAGVLIALCSSAGRNTGAEAFFRHW